MVITPNIQKQLDELRVVGLARYAVLKSAEQAYKDALEREKAAYEYAANHGEFFTEDGERVTGEDDSFLMSQEAFANEFSPLITAGYKELFGLDYPVGYTPIFEQFLTPLNNARKAYRQIAADYLRICGQESEAQNIERVLDGYVPSAFMEKLDKINQQFLGISS